MLYIYSVMYMYILTLCYIYMQCHIDPLHCVSSFNCVYSISLTLSPVLQYPSATTAVAYSENGRLLAAGHRNGQIHIWEGMYMYNHTCVHVH